MAFDEFCQLRKDNKVIFFAENPPPKKVMVSNVTLVPKEIPRILHEDLTCLCLHLGIKAGKYSMGRARAKKLFINQLLAVQKLKGLIISHPSKYCKLFELVYRNPLGSHLTKLGLHGIIDGDAISLKFVKMVVTLPKLQSLDLVMPSYKMCLLSEQAFYILMCDGSFGKLAIDAKCYPNFQAIMLHRALQNKNPDGVIYDALTIRGAVRINGTQPENESAWRSIFGEVARGSIGKFYPRSMGCMHRLVSGPIKVLEYCQEIRVLGGVVPWLPEILEYRARPTCIVPPAIG